MKDGLLHSHSFVVQGERLKKPKYVYKTAEELIATGPTKRQVPEVTSELAKVKVIDMTGKEQRVLSGIKDLSLFNVVRCEDMRINI